MDQLQPMEDTIERIYGDAQVQLGIGAPTPETGTVAPGAAILTYCYLSFKVKGILPSLNCS